MSSNKIQALVPIRAGSKGLPNKNILSFDGDPLYMKTVKQGIRTVGSCVISTDIPSVLSSAKMVDCSVIKRPDELSGDEVEIIDVIYHILLKLKLKGSMPETIILLQCTSPLRGDDDIEKALSLYLSGKYSLVLSVTKANSAILKYGMLEEHIYTPLSDPTYGFKNRQQLPAVFRPNGAIYIFSASRFVKDKAFATENIGAHVMTSSQSLDIDSREDFKLAEQVYKNFNK